MNIRPSLPHTTLAAIAAFAALTLNASAATSTFNGSVDSNYLTPGNWDPSGVPNTGGGDTALINNGSSVIYNPGGDLFLGNGGTLEIRNGSWTQINGIAWIQLGANGAGNGHILVSGGTFNQGSAEKINVTGAGNTFTMTSGAANLNGALTVASGVGYYISGGTMILGAGLSLENGSIWQQSGGTVTLGADSEFDYSSLSGGLMSGGILNVSKLMTGVNGPAGATFDFAGGVINNGATAFSGWYGADNADHPFNFTLGSTGVINFLNGNTTIAQVNAWLLAGGIQYNHTIDPLAFSVTQDGSTVSLQLAVPEPSTALLVAAGLGGFMIARRRRMA